jgi:hypothetical protein
LGDTNRNSILRDWEEFLKWNLTLPLK